MSLIPRGGIRIPPKLLLHVLLVQRFHRMPIQLEFLRHILDRHRPTLPPYINPKPLRVKGIGRNPTQSLLLHLPTLPTIDPSNLHLYINPGIPTGQIPYPTCLLVVVTPVNRTTTTTNRFFWARSSWTTRALGSPNTPLISALGRYPGNRYSSSNRLRFPISLSCRIF